MQSYQHLEQVAHREIDGKEQIAIEQINSEHLVFYYLYLFRLFAKPESQIVDEFTRLELICSFLIQADKVIFTLL